MGMFCLSGSAGAAAPPAPGLAFVQDAQRMGWDFASVLAQGMTAADPKRFPGIHAWLRDFRAAGGTPGKRLGPEPVRRLDAERLVTRNPNFWRAYFELSPGDPGAMLLHASLLMAGGEASRAAYLLIIGRQTIEIDKGLLQAMNELLIGCQRAIAAGAQQVEQAVKQYEHGGHTTVLIRLRAAIEAWPANGLAHYEAGLAMLAGQYTAAGTQPPPRSRLGLHSELAPSREVRAAYDRARNHDPLLIRAYQGDENDTGNVLLVLGKQIRPLWDILARDIKAQTRDDDLRSLAAALREAGLPEMALALGQVIIGREGGTYDDADRSMVAGNLRALAEAAVGPVIKRLSQPNAETARLVLP
jgi:hypothetical protein